MAKQITLGAGGDKKYISFSKNKVAKGTAFEGTYKGVVQGKFTLEHTLETDNGNIVLDGFGKLNKLLANVAVGTPVRIIYLGMEVGKSGQYKGKEMHDCELWDISDESNDSPSSASGF